MVLVLAGRPFGPTRREAIYADRILDRHRLASRRHVEPAAGFIGSA
jgi:hypothetical protein